MMKSMNIVYGIFGLIVYGTGFYWSVIESHRPLGLFVIIVGSILCSKTVLDFIIRKMPDEDVARNYTGIFFDGRISRYRNPFFTFVATGFYVGIPLYTSILFAIVGYVCEVSALRNLLKLVTRDVATRDGVTFLIS